MRRSVETLTEIEMRVFYPDVKVTLPTIEVVNHAAQILRTQAGEIQRESGGNWTKPLQVAIDVAIVLEGLVREWRSAEYIQSEIKAAHELWKP